MGGRDRKAVIYGVTELFSFHQDDEITVVSYSPPSNDDKRLAVGGWDKKVVIYDTMTTSAEVMIIH